MVGEAVLSALVEESSPPSHWSQPGSRQSDPL